MSEAIPLDQAFESGHGQLVTLSPLVRRIVAPNASPFTFHGTCTYVVGHGEVAIIDPGPDIPIHIDALLAALAGETITQILVTHTHRDHSPGARLLKERTSAPIIGCAAYQPARTPRPEEAKSLAASNDLDFEADRVLEDGDIVQGAGFTLQALATPGHTMNHLAFALPEERTLFSGDHVMAWSTTIVAPPTGSMSAYIGSLTKLRDRDEMIYWPGHGGPVRDPQRFVRALLHHRRQREASIIARLLAGDEKIDAIVSATYENLDSRLKRAAAYSVLAHMEDLVERGRVTHEGTPGLEGLYRLA